MNRFRNLLRSMDRPSDSTSTNQSTTAVSDRNSDDTLGRSIGHQRSQSQPQPQPQSQSQSQSRGSTTQPHSHSQWRDRVTQYSSYSTQGPFHKRMFFSENFMLGAGAVIIQPSSGKVIIVQDGDSWFLPKGRKDLGESIEQAALREAYEESGYQCEFLPLYHWTNAPTNDSRLVYGQKHTEPLYVTITSYAGRRNRPPGEYLTFWYACQIGPDAARVLGTGMPDEAGYIGHLVTYEVAAQMLGEAERLVLTVAYNEWVRSIEIDERIRMAEVQRSNSDNGERT